MSRPLLKKVATLLTFVTLLPVSGTLVNVDFNSSGPDTSVGTFSGTGVLGDGTWNAITAAQSGQSLGATSLLDSTGAASGIQVSIPSYQGAWNLASQTASSWKPLLGDWIYLNTESSTATITLSGLGASTRWNLVFYGANGNARGSDFTIDAITKRTTDSGGFGTTLTEGDEYIQFDNILSDGSGNISIGWENYGVAAPLNGFQIVSVPEVSTLSMFALIGVSCMMVYYRRPKRS